MIFFPEYLKEQLDSYMSKLPKVRIIRLKERQGLIRARLAGAAAATGSLVCCVCGTLKLQNQQPISGAEGGREGEGAPAVEE